MRLLSSIIQLVRPSTYHNLNYIEVSRSALAHNHRVLQAHCSPQAVVPVLKSNAYGHGLRQMARIFDDLHPPFVAVDSLFEAYELLQLKLKTPILILGYTHPKNLRFKQLPFHFTLFDLESARALNRTQRHCQVHIFVDTGMNREGVAIEDLPGFIMTITELKNLEVVGLASHFADADGPDNSVQIKLQRKTYQQALKILQQQGITPRWRHIAASAGALKLFSKVDCNIVRIGLASYGISPLPTPSTSQSIALRPALKFMSTLAQIKSISAGKKVGYNGTFTSKKPMKLGLVPAGYYDGVDRRLSNRGCMSIRGVYCPIVGRVSMNMTTIDISAVSDATVGEAVMVYSDVSSAKNSVMAAAQIAQTIPYELLVRIAESVKRRVVD